jgi:hypothetical protein
MICTQVHSTQMTFTAWTGLFALDLMKARCGIAQDEEECSCARVKRN